MRHRHTPARELAMQLLFQKDLHPSISDDAVTNQIQRILSEPDLQLWTQEAVEKTLAELESIDAKLSMAAENWKLSRMTPIDRNILRLGAHELCQKNLPAPVVLDEAVELAKKYGSADSPAFINGVLDRLHRDLMTPKAAEPAPVENNLSANIPD